MKITKALAILFALVLVVVCFNAPAVYSYEDHPWDEDGDGSGGGDGSGIIPDPDTTIIRTDPADPEGDPEGTDGFGWPKGPGLWLDLQFLFWYHNVPDYKIGRAGGQNTVRTGNEATSTNSR